MATEDAGAVLDHGPRDGLPACGLYRAPFALEVAGTVSVPSGTLLQFHNHSPAGGPAVWLPDHAEQNRWVFGKTAIPVDDRRWVASLIPRPTEGLYELDAALAIGQGRTLPAHLLVQLGYTRAGQPVAFPGVLLPGPTIRFEPRGLLLSDLQLPHLVRTGFRLLVGAQPAPAPAPAERPIPDEWDA